MKTVRLVQYINGELVGSLELDREDDAPLNNGELVFTGYSGSARYQLGPNDTDVTVRISGFHAARVISASETKSNLDKEKTDVRKAQEDAVRAQEKAQEKADKNPVKMEDPEIIIHNPKASSKEVEKTES